MASSFLMSPSCCETTAGANDPLTPYNTGTLYLPFPTNNYNLSFTGNGQIPFCSLPKITNTFYTPYNLIDVNFASSYDISVFILSDAVPQYPNSRCFKRKYETSNGTLSALGGYTQIEYPSNQPYEIRIIVTQKCGVFCEVTPSEFGKKRKQIFSKYVTQIGTLPTLQDIISDSWQNKYSNYTLVPCSEQNIPNF